MRSSRVAIARVALLLLVPLGVLAGRDAVAQEARAASLRLVVLHAAPGPGGVGPEARPFHEQLRRDFKYQSLRVLTQHRRRLVLNRQERVMLPTGSEFRIRAMEIGERGLLLAVEVPGRVNTQLRVPKRRRVLIAPESYQGGKLIISIESDY